ncbi:hypothetical protein KC717_04375 [Candidatus Dojkabacteria bacterium]|uniref:Uncharacterized protein n=1 Tax=Candidatus Dojkabacteria bacterium TaxID=2099670 RepID=A0A955RKX7_9BACT|nr:hypothetical protein [Candidatus Dojkabacteria bacterium]
MTHFGDSDPLFQRDEEFRDLFIDDLDGPMQSESEESQRIKKAKAFLTPVGEFIGKISWKTKLKIVGIGLTGLAILGTIRGISNKTSDLLLSPFATTSAEEFCNLAIPGSLFNSNETKMNRYRCVEEVTACEDENKFLWPWEDPKDCHDFSRYEELEHADPNGEGNKNDPFQVNEEEPVEPGEEPQEPGIPVPTATAVVQPTSTRPSLGDN